MPNGGEVGGGGEGGVEGLGTRGNRMVAATSGMLGGVEGGGGVVPDAVSGSPSAGVSCDFGAHGGTAGSSGCGGVSGG